MVDGLTCSFEPLTMGAATERDAAAANVTRQNRTRSAVRSHDRAAAAMKSGRLGEEIVPVSVPRRRGDPILVFEDEGVRPGTKHEQLASLRSAFAEGGAITAGNASQISDGAAALVVASPAAAATWGSARWQKSSPTARWPVPARRCSRSRQGLLPPPSNGLGSASVTSRWSK